MTAWCITTAGWPAAAAWSLRVLADVDALGTAPGATVPAVVGALVLGCGGGLLLGSRTRGRPRRGGAA